MKLTYKLDTIALHYLFKKYTTGQYGHTLLKICNIKTEDRMNKKYIHEETFEGIDFQEKGLDKGEYEDCTFVNCIFSNLDLSKMTFIECEFNNCNFSMADISTTVFRDVRFKACKLLGLPFEHCNELLLSMNFEDCQLDFASFYKLNLKGTIFKNCSLKEADFTESDLTESIFSNCDLTDTVFKNTDLEKADFRTSFNFSIDPEMNQIKKAKFSLSGLEGLLDRYEIEVE